MAAGWGQCDGVKRVPPDCSKDLPVRFLENTDSQDTCGADSGDGA